MNDFFELKQNFEKLKSIRLNIRKLFESINALKEKLKTLYLEYIEIGKKNNILFGIDSFHFQKILIDLEYDNMDKMYKLIDNKMYCEYYKLLKVISKYAEEKINDKKIQALCKLKSKYPIYKDLDQFKVYEFEFINDLHHDIIQLLDEMFNYSIQKEKELKLEEEKTSNGLNIDNYVNTLIFDNAILTQNIRLYKRYLQVFHKYHNTYLSRLYIKLGIMWGQLNQDIKLGSMSSNTSNEQNKQIITNKVISPRISSDQQAEIYNFMKESGDNNSNFKIELDTIISHISGDSDEIKDESVLTINKNEENKVNVIINIDKNNEKINLSQKLSKYDNESYDKIINNNIDEVVNDEVVNDEVSEEFVNQTINDKDAIEEETTTS